MTKEIFRERPLLLEFPEIPTPPDRNIKWSKAE
jgi:hypothetical protein